MSALWHPRLFNSTDFPGYRRLYRRLVETALEMGAWVGSPGDYYAMMDHPVERASESIDGTKSGSVEAEDPDRPRILAVKAGAR
jgi:hypothetical protein